MKKMRMAETATPESNAADNTSIKHQISAPQKPRSKKMRKEEGGKRTIVLRPPSKVTSPNNIIENKPNDRPSTLR